MHQIDVFNLEMCKVFLQGIWRQCSLWEILIKLFIVEVDQKILYYSLSTFSQDFPKILNQSKINISIFYHHLVTVIGDLNILGVLIQVPHV